MSKTATQSHGLQDAHRRFRRYASIVMWMLRDGLLRFRRRVILILSANLAGMGLQLSAFGLIFATARALERGATLTFMGLTFTPRESPAGLALIAVFSTALLAAAGVVIYFSRTRGIGLRRRYEEFCSKRVLLLASKLPLPTADVANRILAENGVSMIAHRHARTAGRVLWTLVNGSIPVGRAIIALVVMFAISWYWTLAVVCVMPVAGYLLYGVNVSAARASWRRDRRAAPASRAKRLAMQHLVSNAAPLSETDAVMGELFHKGKGRKMTDAFFERFVIRERAQLVSNLFAATAILAVLLVAGMEVFKGQLSWTALLAYLVALRIFLSSTRGVLGVLLQVSRFYPYLRRYCDFVQDARAAERTVRPEDASRHIKLDIPSLEGAGHGLTLRPGDRAWLWPADRVDRALAAWLQVYTVAGEGPLPGSYSFAAGTDDIARLAGQPHSAALIRAGDLPALAEADRESLSAKGSGRILVLATEDLPETCAPEEPVLLLNEAEPDCHGWCTAGWLKANQELQSKVKSLEKAGRHAVNDEEDDEDDM